VIREILRTSLSRLVGGVDILVLPRGQLPVDDYQKVKAELLKCLEGLGLLMKGAEAPTSIQDAED
jgi:RNase P protein component